MEKLLKQINKHTEIQSEKILYSAKISNKNYLKNAVIPLFIIHNLLNLFFLIAFLSFTAKTYLLFVMLSFILSFIILISGYFAKIEYILTDRLIYIIKPATSQYIEYTNIFYIKSSKKKEIVKVNSKFFPKRTTFYLGQNFYEFNDIATQHIPKSKIEYI